MSHRGGRTRHVLELGALADVVVRAADRVVEHPLGGFEAVDLRDDPLAVLGEEDPVLLVVGLAQDLGDLGEAEAHVLAAQDHRDPRRVRLVVVTAAADALGRREQTRVLPVAQDVGREAEAPGERADGELIA